MDIGTFVGTFGLFFTLFLLFLRFLPVIAMGEVKGVLHQQINHGEGRRALMADSTSFSKLPLPGFLKPAEGAKHYGVMGDFDTPEDLLRAIRTARTAGYTKMDAYTPFPDPRHRRGAGRARVRRSAASSSSAG